VDESGAAYVTGQTGSSDFPSTPGAFDTTLSGHSKAFVVKVSSDGSTLVYASFLGGSNGTAGLGIAVDGVGAAYITGVTWSSDFPITPGAFAPTYVGDCEPEGWGGDSFVTKLSPTGSGLAYSAFLGGNRMDEGDGIAVDGSGAAYVTGQTGSSDFPSTPGAFDTTPKLAFVVKLNPTGSGLVYATFYSKARSNSIAVDGSGAAYVTGLTGADLPTTPGAFNTTFNGGETCIEEYCHDAFVTKLNPTGSGLVYSTFLGGSEYDIGTSITVDGSGSAYLTGLTYSSNFPITPGAFDTTYNGGNFDAFVVKMSSDGSLLSYSSFLGGSAYERGSGIAVDDSGTAYVSGGTGSSNFPTTAGAFDTTYNGSNYDAFAVKVFPDGSTLSYASFLGGSALEISTGIAVNKSAAAYVTGRTYSCNFPTTLGAFDTTFNVGSYDAFVVKLDTDGPTTYSVSGYVRDGDDIPTPGVMLYRPGTWVTYVRGHR